MPEILEESVEVIIGEIDGKGDGGNVSKGDGKDDCSGNI
jgi:hypothetical protein